MDDWTLGAAILVVVALLCGVCVLSALYLVFEALIEELAKRK